MDEVFVSMGARIAAFRKEKGISQSELAEALDISVSYLSKIENGKCNFGVDILMRITEVLQVSADSILRSATPAVTAIYAKEIEGLLADCSPSERDCMIHVINEFKSAVKKLRQSQER